MLGQRIRVAEFPDFNITQSRYVPGSRLATHQHEFTYLSLVLRGGFEESVAHKTEMASSGSVVVMPHGVAHGECIGPLGAPSVTITVKGGDLTKQGLKPLFDGWRWFHGGSVARVMIRAYRAYLLAESRPDIDALELLCELSDAVGGETDWQRYPSRRCVAAALEILHSRNNFMRLSEIASELGKDSAYLARAFRRQIGCTMSEYRRRLWVREAARLLSSTQASLTDVALSAGFADQSHLCRVFKAELGLTPLAYRRVATLR